VYQASGVSGVVKPLINPGDPSVQPVGAPVSYAANSLVLREGNPFTAKPTLELITDGTSNTLMFIETYANCETSTAEYTSTLSRTWNGSSSYYGEPIQAAPAPGQCDVSSVQSPWSSGPQIAMADGSVRSLRADVSLPTLTAILTPDQKDSPGADW
jgi:hypothetical protein